MKKLVSLLIGLMFIVGTTTVYAQTPIARSTTSNFAMVKPATTSGSWGEDLNDNFDTIDANMMGSGFTGDVQWRSGTAFTGTLAHALTSARTWDFPDVAGTVAILGSNTAADIIFGGTTPQVTIGDADEEDTALVYDGNAQDFYVGLDDGTDSLIIGLGSAVGTNPAITIVGDGTEDVTLAGALTVTGAQTFTGLTTHSANVVSDTDSTDDLGLTGTRWANLYVDDVLITNDLAVAEGGTGVSTLTDGGVLLGSGSSDITVMAVLSDSEFIVGDGTTDPVAESGQTARTSMGAGIISADYLVGTADTGLSGEIAVGATPQGELGNTWASPTVDSSHSGTAHHLASDAGPPNGTASGELGGSYPSPTVDSTHSGSAHHTQLHGISGSSDHDGFIFIRQTSEQTATSDITVNDHNAFTFAVGATETWWFSIFLIANEGAGAGGIRATTTCTGDCTSGLGGLGFDSLNQLFETLGNDTLGTLSAADILLVYSGFVRTVGTSGTWKFRWAQQTSDVVATTVKLDSYMIAWRD